jgi:hypothetical protein
MVLANQYAYHQVRKITYRINSIDLKIIKYKCTLFTQLTRQNLSMMQVQYWISIMTKMHHAGTVYRRNIFRSLGSANFWTWKLNIH